jgi:arylsulfatase A-like enzyme
LRVEGRRGATALLLLAVVAAAACSEPRRPNFVVLWLPKIFSEQGYATVGLHTHRYLHRSVSNIYRAFDEYYYPVDRFVGGQKFLSEGRHWTDYMYLDTLYPACDEWLEANYEREFLMYVHVIDVHGPYNRVRILEEDRQSVEKGLEDGSIAFSKIPGTDLYALGDADKKYLYDGHIRYVDEYLQKLVGKLAELGVRDDTYVIFTSDHGEDFGEHGGQWGHGHSVYNTQIRIPLVVLLHRDLAAARRRIRGHVNTVGLLATLAELAGIELPPRMGCRSFARLLRSSSEPHARPARQGR